MWLRVFSLAEVGVTLQGSKYMETMKMHFYLEHVFCKILMVKIVCVFLMLSWLSLRLFGEARRI